ncbi:cobalt-zinc-cadmium efflux system protein [Thermomonospora echinospora]|uniref:Cobalt-zinc-cadmium efflux system protein n=1 Tax=Thermomonospora echinospora TaxID=1992 RepID=A0A1H5X2L6_9ACTN|nr:cation diffusion facilitator family transporter [Thermomonospora echinospora]SEG06011.1 cobalt-zinc-cadmium efflux system protein [Thermomonospora echinospora]
MLIGRRGLGAGHGHGHGHGHVVSAATDRRRLAGALALIVALLAVEVAVGLAARSLALLSDAAHLLTDVLALVLALIAMRIAARPPQGGYTYGLRRAEILSAQLNGLTLILLAVCLGHESVHRLLDPPVVDGMLVFWTSLGGIGVNLAAAWLLSRADRGSLNVEGAFQHVLNDLYAFVSTAVAGLVVWTTGFARADVVASLVVAGLMAMAGYGLLRDAGRVLMEAAPAGIDPAEVGARMVGRTCVQEVHDLHVWEVTSGYPALSAHVLVEPGGDCHAVRRDLRRMLADSYGITHATLEVDHVDGTGPPWDGRDHCAGAHGPRHVPTAVPRPRPRPDGTSCGH